MKTTFALFFFLLISSAAFGWGSPRPQPAPEPAPQEPQIFVPAQDPGHVFTQGTVTATVSNAMRITRLIKEVEGIINSEKFKARVLNAWYNGKAQFKDTTLSNEEVYKALREGAELDSSPDWTWNVEVEISKARCSTLGWTYPNVRKFWINSCGFEKRADAGLAGTICHEYAHKLGFKHDFQKTPGREFTVPYAVGTICAELFNQSESSQP